MRVDGQQKSLAGMETDQKHAEDLVATTQKDREELLRQKAVLEKYGKRTEEIKRTLDQHAQDPRDTGTWAAVGRPQETPEPDDPFPRGRGGWRARDTGGWEAPDTGSWVAASSTTPAPTSRRRSRAASSGSSTGSPT